MNTFGTLTRDELIEKLEDLSQETFLLYQAIERNLPDDKLAHLAGETLNAFSNQMDAFSDAVRCREMP